MTLKLFLRLKMVSPDHRVAPWSQKWVQIFQNHQKNPTVVKSRMIITKVLGLKMVSPDHKEAPQLQKWLKLVKERQKRPQSCTYFLLWWGIRQLLQQQPTTLFQLNYPK